MSRSSRPKRRSKRTKLTLRKRSGPAGMAAARRLQTAHVKRRQAHTSSRSRRRQARRDRKS